jgi:acylphosphatase
MENYRFIVSGEVQGVFYRKSVSQKLHKLKFNGYIKNLKDGTVEVVVVNLPKERLTTLLEILKEGSKFSRVDSIRQESISFLNIKGFEIRY